MGKTCPKQQGNFLRNRVERTHQISIIPKQNKSNNKEHTLLTCIETWYMTEISLQTTRERNGLCRTDYSYGKQNQISSLPPIINKLNFRCINDISVKWQSFIIPKENKDLSNCKVEKIYLSRKPKRKIFLK